MLANYELRFYNPYFMFKFSLTGVVNLEFSRKKNDEGIAVIELSGNNYSLEEFEKDSILEIYRVNSDGRSELQGGTCWFLRKVEYSVKTSVEANLTLTFYDTVTLLTRRIVAWAATTEPNYPSIMLEPLDDILHLIMHFNYGGGTTDPTYPNNPPGNLNINYFPSGTFSATPLIESWQYGSYGTTTGDLINRQLPIQLQIPPSLSSLAETHNFALETVLKAMQDIAEISALKGESLWFDIEYIPATTLTNRIFSFKTWVKVRGVDRTSGINRLVLGPEYKNMTNVSIIKDWTEEATIIYIGGNGDNDLKDMASVGIESPGYPFYPIESYISTNLGSGVGVHNTTELKNEGYLELAKKNKFQVLTGDIISIYPTEFGKDFFFGDLVIAKYKSFEAVVEIAEYKVTVDRNGETIEIPFSTLG